MLLFSSHSDHGDRVKREHKSGLESLLKRVGRLDYRNA